MQKMGDREKNGRLESYPHRDDLIEKEKAPETVVGEKNGVVASKVCYLQGPERAGRKAEGGTLGMNMFGEPGLYRAEKGGNKSPKRELGWKRNRSCFDAVQYVTVSRTPAETGKNR